MNLLQRCSARKNFDRDLVIFQKWILRSKLKDIAKYYGLSVGRVDQISIKIERELRKVATLGGRANNFIYTDEEKNRKEWVTKNLVDLFYHVPQRYLIQDFKNLLIKEWQKSSHSQIKKNA